MHSRLSLMMVWVMCIFAPLEKKDKNRSLFCVKTFPFALCTRRKISKCHWNILATRRNLKLFSLHSSELFSMSCWLTLISVGENHYYNHTITWHAERVKSERENEKTGWLPFCVSRVENHSEKCSSLTQAHWLCIFFLSRSFFSLSNFYSIKKICKKCCCFWYSFLYIKKKNSSDTRQRCVLWHGETFLGLVHSWEQSA